MKAEEERARTKAEEEQARAKAERERAWAKAEEEERARLAGEVRRPLLPTSRRLARAAPSSAPRFPKSAPLRPLLLGPLCRRALPEALDGGDGSESADAD